MSYNDPTDFGSGPRTGSTTPATHANKDPITNEPGAHPVGAGVGAGVGGTIGAVVGAVAGPVGVVSGAALGGALGGVIGKNAAEVINPTTELEYWRSQFDSRPYGFGRRFEDFQPAYHATVEAFKTNPNWSYDHIEGRLRGDWLNRRGASSLEWADVRDASKDAWDRLLQRAQNLTSATHNDSISPARAAEERAAEESNTVVRELNNSIAGYRSAVEKVDNPTYRAALREFVSERERFIAELKPLITQRGETPTDSGSVMGAVQRSWMALTSALGGGDAAIVTACERSEDSVVKAYEDALDSEKLTPQIRDVITRQYTQVRRAHDLVKAWRDQYQVT